MYTIIGADQKEYGPIAAEQIALWIAEGRVNGKTLAKVEGGAWKPVSTFPELAVHLSSAPVAPPLGAAGAPPPAVEPRGPTRESALAQVRVPAIGLMVAAILGIFETVVSMFITPKNFDILGYLGLPREPQSDWVLKLAEGPGALISNLLGLALCAFILFGAIQLKSLRMRGVCIAACIISLLPCACPACCISLPFGIWALVILSRPEVNSQFN